MYFRKTKINNKLNSSAGFLMIELLVSSAIIVTVFLGASAVAQKSLQVSRQAVHGAQASFLLEEGAEAVRVYRDNAWTNISSLSTASTYYPTWSSGTWTLSTIPNTVGIFSRRVVVSDIARDANDDITTIAGTPDPGTRKIVVTVSWQEGSTTVTKNISFYITNLFS